MGEGESEDRTVLLPQVQHDLSGIGTVEEQMPISDNGQVEGTWRDQLLYGVDIIELTRWEGAVLEMRVDEQDSDEDEQREDGVEGVREAE